MVEWFYGGGVWFTVKCYLCYVAVCYMLVYVCFVIVICYNVVC